LNFIASTRNLKVADCRKCRSMPAWKFWQYF